MGFDVVAGSAVVDLEGWTFAVGVVEDMLSLDEGGTIWREGGGW